MSDTVWRYTSRGFRKELFLDPVEYQETLLRDRKRNFPLMSEADEKSEFVRDFIALANSARLVGERAYLLFGLTDGPPVEVCGIEQYLSRYKGDTLPKKWERAQREIGQTVETHIQPVGAGHELKCGYIDGKLVAYLMIPRMASRMPFQVKNRVEAKRRLHSGQSWIRFGESKREVSNELSWSDTPWRYCWTRAPYPLPSAWADFYQGWLSNQHLGEAQTVAPYQELVGDSGLSLAAELNQFLSSDVRVLFLTGGAGCGKSVLIQRVVHELAEAGLAAVAAMRTSEEFGAPPAWLPIYLSLRNALFQDHLDLAKELLRAANSNGCFWEQEPIEPELLLEADGLKWVVFLDGLDEIARSEDRIKLLGSLRRLIRRFNRLKVVVTTRPEFKLSEDIGRVLKVAPLTSDQVQSFLSNYLDDVAYAQLSDLLQQEDELVDLCRIPLFLHALADALSQETVPTIEDRREVSSDAAGIDTNSKDGRVTGLDSPIHAAVQIPHSSGARFMLDEPVMLEEVIPRTNSSSEEDDDDDVELSLGWVVARAYRRLRDREASRQSNLVDEIEDWWDGLGRLALDMDGHKQFIRVDSIRDRFLSEDGVHWACGIGLLQSHEHRLRRFSTHLTQLVMAADFLEPYVEKLAERDAKVESALADCSLEFRESVQTLMCATGYQEQVEQFFQEVSCV